MIFEKYLKRKFIYSKPRKSKILLFDKKSEIFHSYFKNNEFSSLNLSKEINFYIFDKINHKF